jgi:hypothetical protein
MNGNDIKSLLKHVVQKGDSPLRTKIKDLREQLHRRKQRLEMFNLFDHTENNNSDIRDDNQRNDIVQNNERVNNNDGENGTIEIDTTTNENAFTYFLSNAFVNDGINTSIAVAQTDDIIQSSL